MARVAAAPHFCQDGALRFTSLAEARPGHFRGLGRRERLEGAVDRLGRRFVDGRGARLRAKRPVSRVLDGYVIELASRRRREGYDSVDSCTTLGAHSPLSF